MRRFIAILGTLLAMMILISGSAVAPWAVAITDYDTVTNRVEALGADNGDCASLGEFIPPAAPELGWMILDLGFGNEMLDSQVFTVYHRSSEPENYSVSISTGQFQDDWVAVNNPFTGDDDLADNDFTTPSTPGKEWRYIKLVGLTGSISPSDPIFGPEIDAVGYI